KPLLVTQSVGFALSPRFNPFGSYPSNTSCSWTFVAPQGKVISIRFIHFQLDHDCKDAVYFYDGHNENSKLLHRLCSYRAHNIMSKSNVLHMKFESYGKSHSTGFQLYFEFVSPIVTCNQTQIQCRHRTKCVDRNKI